VYLLERGYCVSLLSGFYFLNYLAIFSLQYRLILVKDYLKLLLVKVHINQVTNTVEDVKFTSIRWRDSVGVVELHLMVKSKRIDR